MGCGGIFNGDIPASYHDASWYWVQGQSGRQRKQEKYCLITGIGQHGVRAKKLFSNQLDVFSYSWLYDLVIMFWLLGGFT